MVITLTHAKVKPLLKDLAWTEELDFQDKFFQHCTLGSVNIAKKKF